MTTRFLLLPSPLFTVNRLVALLLIGIGAFFVLLALPFGSLAIYLLVLVATVFAVRSVPVQPGAWLSRRAVRRGLAILTAALTLVIIVVPPAAGSFGLLILLGLCDVALGRATQRIGSAEANELDEWQETIRNRAHRLAYAMLAVAVCAVLLIAEAATPDSRRWLGSWAQTGVAIGFVEFLFFLPAMIIAWLEPDRILGEDAPSLPVNTRSRIAIAMVALCVALPLLASLTLFVAPIRTSAYTEPQAVYGPTPGASAIQHCTYFGAHRRVGYGVSIDLPISAVACWDGSKAYEEWGLNSSDCLPGFSVFVSNTTTDCRRITDTEGTLHFSYRTKLRSPIVPFLERDVTMSLVLTKNGKVVQFP